MSRFASYYTQPDTTSLENFNEDSIEKSLSEDFISLEKVFVAMDSLQNIATEMKKSLSTGGLSTNGRAIASISVENIVAEFEMKLAQSNSQPVPGDNYRNTSISMEGVVDTIKEFWKKIKDFFINMWKKIKGWFTGAETTVKKQESEIERLEKISKQMKANNGMNRLVHSAEDISLEGIETGIFWIKSKLGGDKTNAEHIGLGAGQMTLIRHEINDISWFITNLSFYEWRKNHFTMAMGHDKSDAPYKELLKGFNKSVNESFSRKTSLAGADIAKKLGIMSNNEFDPIVRVLECKTLKYKIYLISADERESKFHPPEVFFEREDVSGERGIYFKVNENYNYEKKNLDEYLKGAKEDLDGYKKIKKEEVGKMEKINKGLNTLISEGERAPTEDQKYFHLAVQLEKAYLALITKLFNFLTNVVLEFVRIRTLAVSHAFNYYNHKASV